MMQAPRTTEAGPPGTVPWRTQPILRQVEVTENEKPERGVGKPPTNVKVSLEQPDPSAILNLAVI